MSKYIFYPTIIMIFIILSFIIPEISFIFYILVIFLFLEIYKKINSSIFILTIYMILGSLTGYNSLCKHDIESVSLVINCFLFVTCVLLSQIRMMRLLDKNNKE